MPRRGTWKQKRSQRKTQQQVRQETPAEFDDHKRLGQFFKMRTTKAVNIIIATSYINNIHKIQESYGVFQDHTQENRTVRAYRSRRYSHLHVLVVHISTLRKQAGADWLPHCSVNLYRVLFARRYSTIKTVVAWDSSSKSTFFVCLL
jgi:hypothetical protein